jgi:iron complex outermembrane recepter protein
MKLGPWILVAGIRRDWVKSHTEGTQSQSDDATTGRVGLMYEFANGLTPYVSYAQSFTPIFGADICAGGSCKPIRGEQVEAGLKYNPFPWLTVNASIYDTVERNRLASDPADPLLSIQTGEVHIKGGDVEILANINDKTNVVFGYAYTDADIASGDNIGKRVETVPLHLASLWIVHRFSLFDQPGFLIGGGVRYIGESWDGIDVLRTPAVTLFDAMIGWENEHWRFQFNASNIGDTRYVTTCLARGDCFFGTGRTALATLTYKW